MDLPEVDQRLRELVAAILDSALKASPQHPGAVIVLHRGGSIGDLRGGVVEVNGAAPGLVVPLEPRTVLIEGAGGGILRLLASPSPSVKHESLSSSLDPALCSTNPNRLRRMR